MYSAEAGFYLAAGIINLLLTGLLFALILFFTETSFLKRLAEFLAVLLVLCFQAGVAVYSAINSTVLSSQSDHFGTFPSQSTNGGR